MAKVSVIVPVYNAEQYLDECILSVRNQTFSDWELLLVNDGSKDKSGEMCDRYSAEDNRIKAIHKVNSGVSATRNVGLDAAQGEYVIFLDADDYWYNLSFLEELVALAEENDLDIIRGEYKAVTENGEDLFKREVSASRAGCVKKVIDSAAFIREAIDGEFFLVLSLFKREVIGDLRLNEGQIFLEDMRFYSQLLQRQMRCMYVPIYFYAYRKNTSSASFRIDIRKLADSFGMCEFFHTCSESVSDSSLKAFYDYYSVMMYCWTLETVALDGYFQKRRSIIEELGLNNLYRKVQSWKTASKVRVKSPYFTAKPKCGVMLFRLMDKIRAVRNRFRK